MYVNKMHWTLKRATASQLNTLQTPTSTLTLSGQNKIIPIVYGEDRVAGLHLVRPVIYSSELVMAVAWSWGEIEGVQTIYANGAALPGGVTATHYTGTASQTADATLTAALAGFADTFANIAYTVFSIPTATITGFPGTAQFEAVVRGRKLYDQRDSTTAWSENPALFMYDFITSTLYGPGLTVTGTDACADRCDEVLGGVEARCEAGLTLTEPMGIEATLDVLGTYAETLWGHDGDEVYLVPDGPVDTPDATLTDDDIVRDSLRLSGADLGNQPTLVRVVYREDSGTAAAWTDDIQEAMLPGDITEITSEVRLPGITRDTEAYRKALSRLRRLGFPGRYEWTAFDDGIKFQRGDVVQLPDYRGLSSTQVRIMGVELTSPGQYRISAEHYDASVYPDDVIPSSTTTVPVGSVIPFIGTSTPSGWALYSDADNLLLVGKGASTAIGDTGGSSSLTISGTTGTGGYHNYATGVRVKPALVSSGTGAYANLDDTHAGHTHTYTKSDTKTPNYRRSLLIQKTGSPGEIPQNGGVLADGELVASTLSAMTTYVGRIMGAGTASSGGTGSPFNLSITPAAGGAHDHRSTPKLVDNTPGFGYPQVYVPAPDHTHSWKTVPCTFNVKRRKLAHYVATTGADIIPGAIVGYDSVAALPSGWYECDGSNGTVDLRDYFIEFSTPASAGTAAGDNTITWDGTTSAAGAHDHDGADDGSGLSELASHATERPDHTHTVTGSVAYTPPYYVLKFIQYTGTVGPE